jgi:hypothetical protein
MKIPIPLKTPGSELAMDKADINTGTKKLNVNKS